MLDVKVVDRPYLDSAALFNHVAQEDWAMFLDSGNLGKSKPRAQTERYDVLAISPIATLLTESETTFISNESGVEARTDDPLVLIKEELAKLDFTNGFKQKAYLPGAFGYFSYDLARRFETLPKLAKNVEALPEMAIGIYPVVVVIDHQDKKTQVLTLTNLRDHQLLNGSTVGELEKFWLSMIEKTRLTSLTAAGRPLKASNLVENQTRQEYRDNFAKIRQYTIEGDCYQVNYSKRFYCEVTGSAWSTYQALRHSSPAPYGAYMQFPFAQVLSNSPESFIRCRHREVITSPIKGTRPRDHNNVDRDRAIAQELKNSAKDQAENVMIVDLMRNDLSRCCELGSVKVSKLYALHSFANVHHLISTITGKLKQHLHALDLLRACFPGGSITGAPKIRAMEIIEELEPDRRGLYCGSIAYVGIDGSLETNIAIRTMVIKDGVARFSAGGGLVIDSEVEEEYQELLDKSQMLKRALFSMDSAKS